MIKARALKMESVKSRRNFWLYVAPMLIGTFLFLTQNAHADWGDTTDPNLDNQPTKQGWMPASYSARDLLADAS